MTAIHDAGAFSFVPLLEAACPAIAAELAALSPTEFDESPDSLTTVEGVYDETGWRWLPLHGGAADGARHEANRARCPATARALAAVPGLVNAGFSLFRPGTHLYPHHGELGQVLRCHLPLRVPAGDVGIRFGAQTVRWREGRCLVFDDTVEHEAWNHGDGDRIVLIVTFARPPGPGTAEATAAPAIAARGLFHLAFHVTDLDAARRFYGGVLGCREGRSTATWVDFDLFGHQLSLHLGQPWTTARTGLVGEHRVPMPHFGVVLLLPEWRRLADRLQAAGVEFVLEPQVRYPGQPGEQWTMFFCDPCGNPIEVKGFASLDGLYRSGG
jgi:hypothetical protein